METTITIPRTFLLYKIIPKTTEINDKNIPKTIFDAISLFYSTNNLERANKCSNCLTSTLTLLSNGPDGKTEIKIGTPCICWECGYLGIPESEKENEIYQCNNCKLEDHTNLVEGIQPDGSKIPWIEKNLNC